MSEKKSGVWQYFTLLDDQKAKCNTCKNTFSHKGGATSNLKKHLKSQHVSVFNEYETSGVRSRILTSEESKPGASHSGPTTLETDDVTYAKTDGGDTNQSKCRPRAAKQAKLSSFYIRPASVTRTRQLNEKVLQMMIKDLQPFSIVEDSGFKSLVAALDPTYQLPSRTTFSRVFLPQRYADVLTEKKEQIAKSKYITLTTDTWTSCATENYMAVTSHYIDEHWKMNSILLDCFNFPENHTAENLRNQLINVLNDWNISEKIHVIITDNAYNITAAVRLTGWTHLPCMAHTLNLVVQDALKVIQPLHQKVKKIAEFFHRSTTATAKLDDLQQQLNGKTLKLINDVPTRWNSTFFMFQRICEIQTPLEAALGILHSPVEMLVTEEWEVLKELCTLLRGFDQITVELSAEKNVCVSKIIPLVEGLLSYLHAKHEQSEIKSAKALNLQSELIRGLKTRFSKLQYNSTLAKATYLDPRFKNLGFIDGNALSRVKELLTAEILSLNKEHEAEVEKEKSTVSLSNILDSQEHEAENIVWKNFDVRMSKVTMKKTDMSSAIIEMRQYNEESNINRQDNCLEWWKSREIIYPTLVKLARKYLSVLSTSVPSERIFSKAGQIISDRRSRLKASTARKLIFLNANDTC